MKVKYNPRENTFDIAITEKELNDAFITEDGYFTFLHNIVLHAYGENFAELLFPIKKGEQQE